MNFDVGGVRKRKSVSALATMHTKVMASLNLYDVSKKQMKAHERD